MTATEALRWLVWINTIGGCAYVAMLAGVGLLRLHRRKTRPEGRPKKEGNR